MWDRFRARRSCERPRRRAGHRRARLRASGPAITQAGNHETDSRKRGRREGARPRARLFFCAVACLALLGAPAARAANNVQLALSWLVSGKNAGYFVALQKGFYAEEGLNVTISRGSGSGDTIKRGGVG